MLVFTQNLIKKSTQYIERTTRKGSYYLKFIKFLRLFKHSFYFFSGKKIGEYKSPPNNLNYVGFFDKNSLIHTSKDYRDIFDSRNIYMGGEFKPMKQGIISLYENKGMIMVKKSYIGFQKYNRFYNEIICLHKLKYVNGIPKINYIDYTKCEIYIEYLDGINLSDNKKNSIIINENNKAYFINGFNSLLNQVHKKRVIMYDLRHQNMMIKGTTFCLMDFADSIYGYRYFKGITRDMIAIEIDKLHNEINRICLLHTKRESLVDK